MEKEIDKALASIENAAKKALKVLSDFVGHDVSNSDDKTYPLNAIGQIVADLKTAKAEAAQQAKYEGMTEEEIVEHKAAEREDELANLQVLARQKLEKLKPLAVVAEAADDVVDETDAGEVVPPVDLFVEPEVDPDANENA